MAGRSRLRRSERWLWLLVCFAEAVSGLLLLPPARRHAQTALWLL